MKQPLPEEKILDEVKELDIHGYCGLPQEDNMILDWWTELVTTHELDTIFSKSCYALSKFYALFQRPSWLFYTYDEKGLKLAVWAEPMLSTACVGVWVAPRCRKSKSVFRSMQLIYHSLFTIFANILGITKQENLLTTHIKLGYTVVGKVPNLIDDMPAWIVTMSKESFARSRLNPERR
jgi:hypothetical protein